MRAQLRQLSERWPCLVEIAIPVAFLIAGLLFPLRWVCVLDPDEGYNLIKALLLGDGHRLYADIWSDQPPVLTYALFGWLELAGWTVESGRVLILLCSAVLLWSLHWTLRRTADRVAAATACLLLIVSFDYMRLSVSVMLGLPSLMFAMLAIQSAVASGVAHEQAHPRRQFVATVGSGALLALAVMTKLWVGLLVPVVLVALISARHDSRPSAWLRPVAIWVTGFALVTVAIVAAVVPVGQVAQLIMPHMDVRDSADFSANAAEFLGLVKMQLPFVVLGTIGLIGGLVRRRGVELAPAIWLVLASLALSSHRPLWYHHTSLLAIPLAWGGGLAVSSLIAAQLRRRQRRTDVPAPARRHWPGWTRHATGAFHVTALASIVLVVAGLPAAIGRATIRPDARAEQLDLFAIALIRGFSDGSRPIITDRQILAFRADLRVPPALAVTSVKRLSSGHLDVDDFVGIVDAETPDVVLLSGRRVPPHPSLMTAVEKGRVLIFSDVSGLSLYVTPRLLKRGPAAFEAAAVAVPGCWQAQLSLAQLRQRQHRLAEAVVAWRRAAELAPADMRVAVYTSRVSANSEQAQVTEP